MRVAIATGLLLISILAMGIEFKPHADAKITQGQWDSYYAQVKISKDLIKREIPELDVVIFENEKDGSSYAFTQSGHPAHPAWIARKITREGGQLGIDQVGYFAGKEPPFAQWFDEYLALNEKIKQELQRKYGNTK
jgi:hypothetical protein